jgi:hypothetical protein
LTARFTLSDSRYVRSSNSFVRDKLRHPPSRARHSLLHSLQHRRFLQTQLAAELRRVVVAAQWVRASLFLRLQLPMTTTGRRVFRLSPSRGGRK